MSQQQDMFGDLPPPPKPTDRLFFAVAPDADAVAAIAALTTELKAQHGMRGRPIAAGKLHATLCNLGDFVGMPHPQVARAAQAAAAVAAVTAPFQAGFDTAQTFINRARSRPCVLTGGDGVIGLHALYKALAQAMLKAGLPANPPSYTPHVTLLYDDVTAAPQAVFPIAWTVREFVLLHSRIGQGQPYTVLGRWSLGA